MSADADFLEKIVEYIDTHGHIKDMLAKANGQRCLLGAAIHVEGKPYNWVGILPFTDYVHQKLSTLLGEDPIMLNDHLELEWSDIRDIILNKAKDIRNNA